MAPDPGGNIHLRPRRRETAHPTPRIGRKNMRPDTRMFPCTSLSACKEKEGVQPCCSQFSKGSSYKLSSSKCSPVSPSTHTGSSNAHQFRGMFNKECIIASRPQAKGDMLPKFIKHNKCFTIAARQTAEGDRLQKNPNTEMCIPSLSAGGSARASRRGQRGDGNDVIKN